MRILLVTLMQIRILILLITLTLLRILPFTLNADPNNLGSKNSNRRGGGKICCSNFFVAPNVTKLSMTYCIFEQVKKKI
jgi:hypothetical protein